MTVMVEGKVEEGCPVGLVAGWAAPAANRSNMMSLARL